MQIGVAHHVAQASGDPSEQLVADAMTEAVVDHLEVVEIDEQHRHLTDAGVGEQLVEALDQRSAVGELGEHVVRRRMGQSVGRHTLLGDILDVGDRQVPRPRPR
jgi:hypothetical protein